MTDEVIVRVREDELPAIVKLGSPLHEQAEWPCVQWISTPFEAVAQEILELDDEATEALFAPPEDHEDDPDAAWSVWLPAAFGERLLALDEEALDDLADSLTESDSTLSFEDAREALDQLVKLADEDLPKTKLLWWCEA